jgi:hypothetical protein
MALALQLLHVSSSPPDAGSSLEGMDMAGDPNTSHLQWVQLPKQLLAKNKRLQFCELFKYMWTTQGAIIIGLYRAHTAASPQLPAPLPYVLTAPPMDTLVHKDDYMYALAPESLTGAGGTQHV